MRPRASASSGAPSTSSITSTVAPSILDHVVEPHDVRVLEARQRLGLALEAIAELGIVRDPRVQDLQRDVALEPLVVRTPDHAHAAATQLLEQAISPRDHVCS